MKKYNFIIVITFVSILALVFAQSVYDTSVHAKMQSMEDDHLADVDAAALDMDMNLTVRTVSGLVRWKDNNTPGAIQFGSVTMDNSAGDPIRIQTMLSWDLGSTSTKTWILGSNMMFPGSAYPGARVIITNPNVVSSAGTTFSLGNHILINGIAVGQDVTSVTPQLDTQWLDPDGTGSAPAFQTAWQILSSEGSDMRGIESYGEIAAYINKIQWDFGEGGFADDQINVNGLYIYGMMQQSTPEATNTWTTRTGAAKLGGVYPYYNVTTGTIVGQTEQYYCSADVGSDGTNSRPRLNFPTAGSVRAREFVFGSRNFGPIGVDDLVLYKSQLIFRQL